MKKYDHTVYFTERRKDGSRLAFYLCKNKEKCIHFGERVCFLCDATLKSAVGSFVFDQKEKPIKETSREQDYFGHCESRLKVGEKPLTLQQWRATKTI